MLTTDTSFTYKIDGFHVAEFEVRVDYEYEPCEAPRINCLPEDATPGECASVEIDSVDMIGSKSALENGKRKWTHNTTPAPQWLFDEIIQDRAFAEDLIEEAES